MNTKISNGVKKIKKINCVSCPKFCQKEDIIKLKVLIEKAKIQGYKEIEFDCETGKNIIKNFIFVK